MKSKFAKLFENADGEQLLLTVVVNPDDTQPPAGESVDHGIRFTFELDDVAVVNTTISPMSKAQADQYLEEFSQEMAEELLNKKLEYFL